MRSTPTDLQSWLARRARDLAGHIDALYHGTRYPAAIPEVGALLPAQVGDPVVCLTRSAAEAAFWATLPRDNDEGRGAIFVFERRRLAASRRLHLHKDVCDRTEFEERVWDRAVNLNGAMIGMVSQPFQPRSRIERMRVREHIIAAQECNDW